MNVHLLLHVSLKWVELPQSFDKHNKKDSYHHIAIITEQLNILHSKQSQLRLTSYIFFVMLSILRLFSSSLLHFAWVVDDAKCLVVTRVCVYVCPRPYVHTSARTRM